MHVPINKPIILKTHLKLYYRGHWDVSVGKGACFDTLIIEFHPWNPTKRCSLTSTRGSHNTCPVPPTIIHKTWIITDIIYICLPEYFRTHIIWYAICLWKYNSNYRIKCTDLKHAFTWCDKCILKPYPLTDHALGSPWTFLVDTGTLSNRHSFTPQWAQPHSLGYSLSSFFHYSQSWLYVTCSYFVRDHGSKFKATLWKMHGYQGCLQRI